MKTISRSLMLLLILLGLATTSAQEQPATPPYFNQAVAKSYPLRTEQARELDA